MEPGDTRVDPETMGATCAGSVKELGQRPPKRLPDQASGCPWRPGRAWHCPVPRVPADRLTGPTGCVPATIPPNSDGHTESLAGVIGREVDGGIFSAAFLQDPYPVYHALRESGPIHRSAVEHGCIGAALTCMEAEVAFDRSMTRLPNLRLSREKPKIALIH